MNLWKNRNVVNGWIIWSKHRVIKCNYLSQPLSEITFVILNTQFLVYYFAQFPEDGFQKKKTKLTMQYTGTLEEAQCKSRKIMFLEHGICKSVIKSYMSAGFSNLGFSLSLMSQLRWLFLKNFSVSISVRGRAKGLSNRTHEQEKSDGILYYIVQ